MIGALIILTAVVFDQITKYFVLHGLANVNSIKIIDSLLFFTYVENRGAAFGMLQNGHQLLTMLIISIVAVLFYYIYTINKTDLIAYIAASTVMGGAVGNLIDRLNHGFVIDFIDLRFGQFHYPVFNIADCFVVIGTFTLALNILLNSKSIKKEECEDGNA